MTRFFHGFLAARRAFAPAVENRLVASRIAS